MIFSTIFKNQQDNFRQDIQLNFSNFHAEIIRHKIQESAGVEVNKFSNFQNLRFDNAPQILRTTGNGFAMCGL